MATKQKATSKKWVVKDRTYALLGNKMPLTLTLASKHHGRTPLMWFDEEKGFSRELRYAINQKSPFVDEQKGRSTLQHIVFKDGNLFVSKVDQCLQKLLSLYHPQRNVTYYEIDNVEEAKDELQDIELEIEALNLANKLEVDHAEAVLRVEQGSSVSRMTSQEIKRDLLLFAKEDPALFINLVNDDNVQLRNFTIKATEASIIYLDQEQRNFFWYNNNKKLMTVPFDENPYSAFAAYLKTDEGSEVYKAIEKKFK
ncbi:MAG: hypothetical protein CBC24_00350 [Candidatus Pelagibacter sp. TMED64]|nr:MAG: hypothetical protein CBC24_08055 [Candidatus Pelagibacter sp. TMED64]OUU67847.1 MAG: hypothetical protein CBC24_00350 [Candidatus Pelagibacter sp. TMED64]|tara:strand:- start:373 stop:1137 length:765 start_codon:yes stop_codon:yes gene_type:complete